MFVFRKADGSLVDAPEEFSPDSPDFSLLEDVEEVLCINKVLVKQIRLVAKPAEVRARIRETMEEAEEQAETVLPAEEVSAEGAKPRRGRK